MSPEFDAVLARLRDLTGYRLRYQEVVTQEEARVLVAALDAWKEALVKVACLDRSGGTQMVIADALGKTVAELERLVSRCT